MKLVEDDDLTQTCERQVGQLCMLIAYSPKGIQIASILNLRWNMLCKHLAESNKLSPTAAAFEEHIERARVQSSLVPGDSHVTTVV